MKEFQFFVVNPIAPHMSELIEAYMEENVIQLQVLA